MKGSIIIALCFAAGLAAGIYGTLPEFIVSGEAAEWMLYALMILVGFSIGSDGKIGEILSQFRLRLLAVPAATFIGTLSFTALASLLLNDRSLWDCMAVGSGFAYYSLSSVLITQLKEPVLGAAAAAELGTLALLCNIFRELATIVFAPFLSRFFGPLAPVCSGGATTMDATLPSVIQASGKEWMGVSVFHGVIMDMSVPFLVSFFCML